MSEKLKFITRTIVLIDDNRRHIANCLINTVPLGLEVIVREPVKVRGIDQNGLYWIRLGEIAEQAWFNGRQYNSDVWHEYAKRNLMPDTITDKNGVERSKWLETPAKGELAVISTTELSKGCFSEYTNIVEAFGANLGVLFSANSRENRV